MAPEPKRPVSVWIAQVILGIYAFGTGMMIVWSLYKALTEGIGDPELYLVTTAGVAALGAVFFSGVYGMARRKPWGRWFGVAGLAILLIGAAVTQTSKWISDRDSSFVSARFLSSLLIVLGLAFLVYFIAAGDSADRFFDPRSKTAPESAAEDFGNG